MKLILFLIIFLLQFVSVDSFSQGGWDIGYIRIDSVNKSLIGRIVKIDLKHINKIEGYYSKTTTILMTKDTGEIEINGEVIKFIERRKIYVDMGFLGDQYLEGTSTANKIIQIHNCEIREVDETKIHFRLVCKISDGKIPDSLIEKTYFTWILKDKLDGLITRDN